MSYLESHLVMRVVLIDDAIVEESPLVGLRAKPGCYGLPFLIAPVNNKLHLPARGLVTQHRLQTGSRQSCSEPAGITIDCILAISVSNLKGAADVRSCRCNIHSFST